MSDVQPGIETVETIEEIVVSTELKNIIEALIFASDEPMTVRFIRSIMDDVNKDRLPSEQYVVNAEIIRKAVGDLNRGYGKMGSGFRIIEVGGGFIHATQEQFSSWVGKLAKERARRRLSPTAVETLAIIAYKQPIAKGEVEFIRGVNVDYIINALLEKDLIHITGRASTPGRPLLYGTTQKFLEHFGLNELSDLPKPREISELINETELEVDRRLLAEQQELEFKQDLETKLEGNEGSKNKPQKNSKIKVPDDVKAENRNNGKRNGTSDQPPVTEEGKHVEGKNIEEGESSSENNLAIDEATAETGAVLPNEAAILESVLENQPVSGLDHLETNEPESPDQSSEHPAVHLETDSTSSKNLDRAEPMLIENGPERSMISDLDHPLTVDQQNLKSGSENLLPDSESPEVLPSENEQTISTAAAADHLAQSIESGHPDPAHREETAQGSDPQTGWSKWKNKVKTFFQKLFA